MSLPILPPPPDESELRKAGRREGELRKLRGQARKEAKNYRVLTEARHVAISLLIEGRQVSTDDLREIISIPDGAGWVGNIMSVLANAGICRLVGMPKSCRKIRNAGLLGLWELIPGAEEIARQWLFDHPMPWMQSPENQSPSGSEAQSDSHNPPPAEPSKPTDVAPVESPMLDLQRDDGEPPTVPLVEKRIDLTPSGALKQQTLFEECESNV